MERVRLGVLGAGNIAELNVAGYLTHPDCDVLAVCDLDADVAKEAAERWGAPRVYTDPEHLFADPDIDALEVLTPTHTHHRLVLDALSAGKHISVQKPVANSVDEAVEMERAAADAGLTLRISECFVHYPPLELAKELISEGAIGRPTALRIKTVVGQTDSAFQANLRPEGYGWRLDTRSPGGHLFDDMVHKYAMALWLVDQDIVSVQSVVRRRDLFFEPCEAIFEYEDPGLLGTMEVAYAPQMYLRSALLRGRRVLRGPGGRGVRLGHPGHRRDAGPPPRRPLPRQGPRVHHHRVHRHRRRLEERLRPLVGPLRRLAAGRHPGRHVAGVGHQGPPALLRRLRRLGLAPPGRPGHHHRVGLPRGLGRLVGGAAAHRPAKNPMRASATWSAWVRNPRWPAPATST